MHDSYTPLGGLVPLILIKLGEIIYGGVGSGIYGVMVFVIIAVFMAGLMVGRTPEYMGKKIEGYEVKMASVAALVPSFFILFGTAIALLVKPGLAGLLNAGPHGLSEALYAFASAGQNNGSAFAGLTAATPFWDTLMGLAIFAGRFWVIIPVLAIAGSLVKKPQHPISAGSLPTHTPLFVVFLVCTILIVGALTFFPAWSLGAVAEHLAMIGV
jgi:K+-transporting ATPase ATPase A chain